MEGDKAIALGSKLREDTEKKFGKESIQAGVVHRMIADAYNLNGDSKTAEKEYKTAAAIFEKAAPVSAPMARTLAAQGFMYFERQNPQQAEEMFEKAGEMAAKVGGNESFEKALVLLGQAHLRTAEHRFSEGIQTHHRALGVMEKLGLPGKDPIYAYALLGLAEAHSDTRDYKTSQESLNRAIKEVNRFGDEWKIVKDVLVDEATKMFLQQKNFARTEALAREKLQGVVDKGSGNEPEVADIYAMIASALEGQGKTAEADAEFKKGFELLKDIDTNEPLYQDNVSRYAGFLRRHNRHKEAADLEKTVDRGFERGYERKGFADPK
jgi:tetratricopeptide (TPR) repeat protein